MSDQLGSYIWISVAACAGTLVLVRFATLRRRPEPWWWAYTIAFLGIAVACSLMVDGNGLNHRLGVPNLAYLLAELSIVAAGCSIVVYMGFLLWETPRPAFFRANVLVALVVLAVMLAGWLYAPVHDIYYPTARHIPITAGIVAYELAYHLYVLAFLGFNVAGLLFAQRSVASRDPAATLNWVVRGSIFVIVAGQLVLLSRLAPGLRESALPVGLLGDLITLAGNVGVSVANTVIFLGPRLTLARRSRNLLRDLDPLSTHLLASYPQVHVDSMKVPWWRPSLRAERTLIEISDALCLLRVPRGSQNPCPFALVSRTLLSKGVPTEGCSDAAVTVLPTPRTRDEEESMLVTLSRQVRADAS